MFFDQASLIKLNQFNVIKPHQDKFNFINLPTYPPTELGTTKLKLVIQ